MQNVTITFRIGGPCVLFFYEKEKVNPDTWLTRKEKGKNPESKIQEMSWSLYNG